ncbi:GPI transamidase component PIG-S-like isoform X2 [Choristoneura fumiferana]|uniref:GPI transamidase component PIG-S-like isoform X2 n=1 Tax=Choristoneura fumiferana TaxID=7141 RepID=UPI003D153FB4
MATESSRMWASASFVGVLIVIGVPLWWSTTEVYRVSLPYKKIYDLTSLPVAIATNLVVLANDDATADEIVKFLETSFQDSIVIKLKISKRVLSDSLRHTLESVADEVEAVEEVTAAVGAVAPNTLLCVQRTPLYKQVWLGTDRVVFFRDATAGIPLVDVLSEWIYQTLVLASAVTNDDTLRMRYPPAAGYHIMLSIAVPDADRGLQFPAKEAMEDYVGSFVDELSGIHNFTLKSQWLYMMDFDFEATEILEHKTLGRHFAVPEENLYMLLTQLEKRTATQVSLWRTVNLVLYAVPCRIAPLIIYTEEGDTGGPLQSFVSPEWGSVVLPSPTAEECAAGAPSRPDVHLHMTTFVTQLRPLLGIMEPREKNGATMLSSRSVTPRRWEVDALMRLRLQEQLASGKLALQSLADLLAEISNIVINDEVGSSINAAVEGIYEATELMSQGHLEEAYRVSQKAFLAAEAAFADPSLLALLYFPDDQKYAIYIPLFLPIMFPVVLSLKNLFLWVRGKPLHKEKAD